MDMRFNISIEDPVDLLIENHACNNMKSAQGRYFYYLQVVRDLPSDDPNKAEMQRYVDRIRAAFEVQNLDAVEGWYNALSVSVKSVTLFIPKTLGKLRSEAALPDCQPRAVQSLKAASEARSDLLASAVGAYLAQRVASTRPRAEPCVNWIMKQQAYNQSGKCCGYKKDVAVRYVRPLLKNPEKSDQSIHKTQQKQIVKS